MSTHFGYLAVIEDYYHVGVLRGGDTLSYYYLCAWKVEVSKAVLNILFCFHIHGGGGIVKDKNGRLYG